MTSTTNTISATGAGADDGKKFTASAKGDDSARANGSAAKNGAIRKISGGGGAAGTVAPPTRDLQRSQSTRTQPQRLKVSTSPTLSQSSRRRPISSAPASPAYSTTSPPIDFSEAINVESAGKPTFPPSHLLEIINHMF